MNSIIGAEVMYIKDSVFIFRAKDQQKSNSGDKLGHDYVGLNVKTNIEASVFILDVVTPEELQDKYFPKIIKALDATR